MRRAVTPTAFARAMWRTREEAWIALHKIGRVLPWGEVDRDTRRVYVESAKALLRRYTVRARTR